METKVVSVYAALVLAYLEEKMYGKSEEEFVHIQIILPVNFKNQSR